MQKRHFPFALAGILITGYAAGGLAGLVLAAIGLSAAYLLSLRLHPRIRHSRCRGTGEHRGAVFTWTHHRCGGCQGGRIIRRGAGIWGAEHIRHEHTRARQARESARSAGSWR